MARDSGCIQIVLTLSTEVIALHMQALIVKIGVPGLEGAIAGYGICLELAILLAFNEQFYGQLDSSLQVLVRVSPRRAWNGGGSGSGGLSRSRSLSRRRSESTKDGGCRNGSTAIISRGSASIAAGAGSGHLTRWIDS